MRTHRADHLDPGPLQSTCARIVAAKPSSLLDWRQLSTAPSTSPAHACLGCFAAAGCLCLVNRLSTAFICRCIRSRTHSILQSIRSEFFYSPSGKARQRSLVKREPPLLQQFFGCARTCTCISHQRATSPASASSIVFPPQLSFASDYVGKSRQGSFLSDLLLG